MAEDVKELINSAAPQGDAAPSTEEPTAGSVNEPVANDVDGGGGVATGGEDMAFVQDLYGLLRSNPDLANRVADVIEEFFGGGEKQVAKETPTSSPSTLTPTGAAGQGTPGGGMPPELMALVQVLDGRLSRLEKSQADMALEREMADTKQEYERLKEHFPILPDLNDKEILQIALQYDGLPLKEALYLWAMQKLQEGEGSVADRLVAARIEQSKNNQAPRVETKGGGIPAGTQEPPKNFREARRRAKEFLEAIAGGPTT
ncbi:hypothetical protein [Caldanaerobius polysaccharolyticus]|uniref:hypothetical protein n=1 Tax=Caldanaerobius polysaccharolyticus TaxID=44256 RepID=UPI00047ABCD8|nr:hypothetical protein [Caldanaerobius polysaccharolyticus]